MKNILENFLNVNAEGLSEDEKWKNEKLKRELLEKNYLKDFQRNSFSEFNLVIGKNGSGKTRMLRFLIDVANKHGDCNVIFLDCSENSVDGTEVQGNFSESLIFNEELSRDSLENLFTNIKYQLLQFIASLEDLCQKYEGRVASLLRKINKYLEKLLGRTIYNNNGKIYINNSSTGEDRVLDQEIVFLSPGERNILIFSLALMCVQLNIDKPFLLLIDEIETHLHPAALQELFKMFRENLKDTNGCVFIATHSIFLLPEFKFEEICYLDQGELKKVNGNVYRDILNSVVYGKDGNYAISELLVSVDSWSYAEFMAECFLPPTVSDRASAGDPQYRRMDIIVKKLLERNGGQKLEVLDFGAGDARIGMCMKMDYESRSSKKEPQIRYHVYDKVEITKDFKNDDYKLFGNKYETKEAVAAQAGKMDIVLLYNVLHEVGIDEWCDELNLALSLLKEDGVLIFSERKTLSVGEKPYGKSGYLLLGKEEINVLFSEMVVEEIDVKEERRRNIWGFAIQNPNRKEISLNNVEDTIKSLTLHTQEKIDEYYHQDNTDHFKARDYAFYCQQFFNAKEAQKILEELRIPEMKLQFILARKYPKQKERELLRQRAEIDDEEGRKCKSYLESNQE